MAHLPFIHKFFVVISAGYFLIAVPCSGKDDVFADFVTKRVNKGKVEDMFGRVTGNAVLMKLIRDTWVGGGSDLVFSQVSLEGWNPDEKALLTLLIFGSISLSHEDITGVAVMLGRDKILVSKKLKNIPERKIADLFGANDGIASWKLRLREFQSAVELLGK